MNEHREEYDSNLYTYIGWRSLLWPSVLYRMTREQINESDIYLFGVFGGKTTIEWCNILKAHDLHPRTLVCFDSFEGIPVETAEPVQDGWHPEKSAFFSAFNAKQYFNTTVVEHAVNMFTERITPSLPEGTDLKVVPGFFDKSLTKHLAMDLNRPSIIDVDVDIYSSTVTVLDWLFANELMDPGTMVGYDDWGGTPGYRDRLDGESRAHREFEELLGLRWREMAATTDMQQVIYRLEK